ncbi:uncharacterized protein LOC132316642 [Cornus florida]|uniref:uncharacterized protein LOC132316642 n=1 Tax=Cornus florida TaxID=4283 RepID=UPI0028993F79|nr:uncharacterized protein LOC132316642 [Cornus florida]
MQALLTQQGLKNVLFGNDKLLETRSNEDKDEVDEKACSAILLNLADEVLHEVIDEDMAAKLWLKLESLYMTKSLTNKLYLKQRLYILRIKKGHIKWNFPKLKNKKKDKKDKKESKDKSTSNSSDIAGVAEESSSDVENILSVSISDCHSSSEWVLDFGCSYHMCPNRDWFSTYHFVDGGTVLMGNDNPYQSVGTAIIQIKMHDAECRVLRVSKGALTMLKGKQRKGLYFLQGSTVTGAASVSSSIDQDSVTTHLWHMRLGHMSERGLTELSKRGLLGGEKTGKLDFCEHCVFGK